MSDSDDKPTATNAPRASVLIGRTRTLHGSRCTYCGTQLTRERGATGDHLVARAFVPDGTMDGQWNLKVPSCADCNCTKSRLEEELAAITMQPNAVGQYASDDPRLRLTAIRKACGSHSSRTRRKVKESEERVIVRGAIFGQFPFTLTGTAPPQPIPSRIERLAKM